MFFDLETTGFDRPIRPVQVLKILDKGDTGQDIQYILMSYMHLAT